MNRIILLVVILLLFTMAAAFVWWALTLPGAVTVPFGQQEMQLSFAPLVKATAPAVVNVYASQQVSVRSPFAGDPFFEQFFGRQQMPPRRPPLTRWTLRAARACDGARGR